MHAKHRDFALLQLHGKDWKLVQCGSRFLSEVDAVIEVEMAAVLWAVRKCGVFLKGLLHFSILLTIDLLAPQNFSVR